LELRPLWGGVLWPFTFLYSTFTNSLLNFQSRGVSNSERGGSANTRSLQLEETEIINVKPEYRGQRIPQERATCPYIAGGGSRLAVERGKRACAAGASCCSRPEFRHVWRAASSSWHDQRG